MALSFLRVISQVSCFLVVFFLNAGLQGPRLLFWAVRGNLLQASLLT